MEEAESEEVSRAPKYPLVWDTWSRCMTCGFSIPSRFVINTRKHGFQCLPGNGRTRGCFDGMYDRDDIYYVYPDGEGTRETDSPLTGWATEGRSGDPASNTMYLRDQGNSSIIYLITFGDTLTATVVTDQTTIVGTVLNAISINNAQEYQLYVLGGTFYIFLGEMNGCGVLNLTSTITVNAATGAGTYTPISGATPTTINPTPPPPPVLQLRVNEAWEWLRYDGVLRVNEQWPITFPSIGSLRVNEGFET